MHYYKIRQTVGVRLHILYCLRRLRGSASKTRFVFHYKGFQHTSFTLL